MQCSRKPAALHLAHAAAPLRGQPGVSQPFHLHLPPARRRRGHRPTASSVTVIAHARKHGDAGEDARSGRAAECVREDAVDVGAG